MTQKTHTLSSLHPAHHQDMRMMNLKTSQRLQGSYRMSLLRPHRIPETSRKYVHGDPVAMIDWKAFARSDQLIVRERRDEASACIRIGVDQSSTMQFHGKSKSGVSKQEIGLRIALNLSHIHLEMGDLVEVWIVKEDAAWPDIRYRPRSPSDIVGLYQHLIRDRFSSESVPGIKSNPVNQKVDQTYWVGDLLGESPFQGFLETGKKSCAFQVMHQDEIDITWLKKEDCYFDQLINDKEFTGEKLKNSYKQQLEEWFLDKEKQIKDIKGLYYRVTDTTSLKDYFQFLETLPKRMM
ncbi:MAG: DUF58 domain-containing protein [Oligoflexales bacterium]